MNETIDFDIYPNGDVKMHVRGIPGKKCVELTKEFEEELGLVVSREKTGEYFQQETHEKQKVGW